jgi:hypothetical protein
MKKC